MELLLPSEQPSTLPSAFYTNTMSTSLTEQEVTSLGALSVFDQSGSKVKLGSVWEQEKTLVVWIR